MLPSGLLLVLETNMNAMAAGVVAVVQGGSSEDPPGAEGLAHLVEHLTFRASDLPSAMALPLADGTAARVAKRRSRWQQLTRYGVDEANAFTTPDMIIFSEFGPATRLPWLIELEGRRLTEPLAAVDASTIAVERRVIESEQDLRNDPRVGQAAYEAAVRRVFPSGSAYARPVNGSEDSRRALTLAKARAFTSRVFRPERMTILVSAQTAATSFREILAQLPRALVGDPDHPVKRALLPDDLPLTDAAPPTGVERVTSAVPSSQLWLGWPLPNAFGPKAATDLLLARWTAGDLDQTEMRRLDPHISGATALLSPGLRASALFVRVFLDDGADVDVVARVMTEHVAALWRRASQEQRLLARLRTTVISELYLGEPGQVTRAFEQAQIAALNVVPTRRDVQLGAIEFVDDDAIAAFAREHLANARASAVIFTPPQSTTDTSITHAAPIGRSASPRAMATDDTMSDAASWDDLERPGARTPFSALSVETLPTGLTLVVAQRRADAAVAWLGFRGGYADADPSLLVAVALRARPEAVDAPRFGMLAGRGASLDASVDTIEFRPAHMKTALPLLFQKATLPVRDWPTPEMLARLVSSMSWDTDAASLKADRAFWRALFAGSPLARTVDKDDLPRVTHRAVDDWVSRVHDLRGAVLVVVGDVSFDDVRALVVDQPQRAGAPRVSLPELRGPALRPPTEAHIRPVVTPRRGRLVDVRLGCLLPPLTPQTRSHVELMRRAMQERLNSALRMTRGEGYGVNVTYEWLSGGTSYLQIVGSFEAKELEDTLATLHANWGRWSAHGFDPSELNVARWRFAGMLAAGGTVHSVASHLLTDWKANILSPGRNTFDVDLSSLDARDVDPLFAVCKANAILGLTGDEVVVRRALARQWPDAERAPSP